MRISDFDTLLPGVPRIESPFFEQIFSSPELDEETIRIAHELHDRGYAVVDFPEPEFDRLAQKIKRDLADRFDWERWHTSGFVNGVGLRVQDAWKTNDSVRQLATNKRILSLLEKLYGRKAHPFQTLNFPVGTQQHFHTDAVHFSSSPERFMCGVWIALEDISEDAGPLYYYPGSHSWPIFNNEQLGLCSAESESKFTQVVYEPFWRALVDAKGVKPEKFLARTGQCLIWTANLLHGGMSQSRSDLTRWSQVTHYYFEGCSYFTPMHSDPMYGHTLFRQPASIITGESIKNEYAGHVIPEDVVNAAVSRLKRYNSLPAGFDAAKYLQANPDVAASGDDPVLHYLGYGKKEGRKWEV